MVGIGAGRQKRRPKRGQDWAKQKRKESTRVGPQVTEGAARAIGALALLAFGAAIWFALTSSFFAVRKVSVVGNQRLSSQQIVELVGIEGRNIFTINTTEVRRVVIGSTALVREVFVDYRLPSDVVIRVEERVSSFVWKVGPVAYEVSSDGVVLGVWRGDDAASITTIEADGPSLSPGDIVNLQALEIVTSLRESLPKKLGLAPREFRYSDKQGVAVTTTGGLQVVFGGSDDLDTKLATLQSVLEEGKARNLRLEYVDVRFKNRPYFR